MRITVTCGSEPQIGRTGENLVTEVAFDTAKWAAAYGPGVAQLKVKRPDGEIYVPPIIMDGTLAVWTLTTTDTAVSGWLDMEWQYFVGEAHKKSETISAWMTESMGPASPEPPEPYQDWVDQVLQAGSDAQTAAQGAQGSAQSAQTSAQSAQTSAQSAQSAEAIAGQEANRALIAKQGAVAAAATAATAATAAATAASHYPKIGANGNWWVWDPTTGVYIDTGVSAEGAPVDPTLTQAGEAADAKATGDAIDQLQFELDYTYGAYGLLESGRNVDAVTDQGTYYATAAVAASLVNGGFTQAHILLVFKSGSRVVQVAVRYAANVPGQIRIRAADTNASFNAWTPILTASSTSTTAEDWTFQLAGGGSVTKKVVLSNA